MRAVQGPLLSKSNSIGVSLTADGLRLERQGKRENGPLSQLTDDADGPTVGLDNDLSNGEPHARAMR